jgi:RPA family protein
MENSQMQQATLPKRNTAYKLRIGTILSAKQNIEGETLKNIELLDKQVARVNVISNITDKYIQEGEKKFGTITLDDGSGQIKAKAFGDDVEFFFGNLNQGDTVMIIGMLRVWNNEIYITPEIIKKKETSFLLIRKYESESEEVKTHDKEQLLALKDKILGMIKEAEKDGGIDIDKISLDLKERPETINQEIKKLLEDGIVYEPRPGKIRYLG